MVTRRLVLGVAWTAIMALCAPMAKAGDGRYGTMPMPDRAPAVEVTGAARAIQGWVDFCGRHPAECSVDSRQPETVRLTRRTWAKIVRINEAVNDAIIPVKDIDHNKVEDWWDFPLDGLGDCEDYQLLKRKLLVEEGIPHRAMRMTVVIDETGNGHAVLTLRTNRGDLVLDNVAKVVLEASYTGYTFLKREGGDAGQWVSLAHPEAKVAEASPPPVSASAPAQVAEASH